MNNEYLKPRQNIFCKNFFYRKCFFALLRYKMLQLYYRYITLEGIAYVKSSTFTNIFNSTGTFINCCKLC